jgi:hypothetical protein
MFGYTQASVRQQAAKAGQRSQTMLEPTEKDVPRFLTTHQMADMLRCCTQTVRNWSRRGLLPPPLAVGRRKRLWDTEKVQEALEKLQGKGQK